MNSLSLSLIDETLRRLQPSTPSANNAYGYQRLDTIEGHLLDESSDELMTYTDGGPPAVSPVEQLFKILFEYAGVELSVTSSIEPLFDKFGQTIFASGNIKHFDVKILPNESIEQILTVNTSVLALTNLNIQSICRQSLEHDRLHSGHIQIGIRCSTCSTRSEFISFTTYLSILHSDR